MNWCRYHGVLTPAKFSGGPTDRICGYKTGSRETSRCTSPVLDLDIFEIDRMVEIGKPERLQLEECYKCKKNVPRNSIGIRGRGGYQLCTPCSKEVEPWRYEK